MNILLLQQWKMTAAVVRRAHSRLPAANEEKRHEFDSAVVDALAYLDHNGLELALDSMTHAAGLVPSRGGVWRDLARAAETMQLNDKTAYLRQRFENALTHVGGNRK